MDAETLSKIKLEIEKIERGSGHGQVVIKIQDGIVHLLQPTPYYLMNQKLDKTKNMCL